ncbi:hypothetical protein ASD8599_02590 [Ascidiaceihabitans donghaensis]|uniref:Glycerophosphoryl diester phosphodiesterase membrane domain-containing protein n=1 Tax=Ascidiaceihabitans donghaensis TaxID=1510460 RepID=A0A2R8BFK1_9RHOB|nr:hypothetical protein [Ascidiaceihabitans donghaensis]SPH21841.1 hypothetical protein ASD8599_02590 [Ascidiaceihabitans donghaensis]
MTNILTLLRDSWRLVSQNFTKTASLCALPILLIVLSGAVLFGTQHLLPKATFLAISPIPKIISWGIYFIAVVLLAVRWHRYALLGTASTKINTTSAFAPFKKYALNSVIFFVIVLFSALAVMAIWAIVFTLTGTTESIVRSPVQMLLPVLMYLVAIWIGLRISLILPAASLEKKMSIKDSWAATATIKWAAFAAYLIIFIAFTLIGILLNEAIGEIGKSFVAFAQTLFSLSLIRVIYAKLVQNDTAA